MEMSVAIWIESTKKDLKARGPPGFYWGKMGQPRIQKATKQAKNSRPK